MSRASSLPAIVACGVDFGWGSAGKLSAILRALLGICQQQLRIIVLGTGLGKPVLQDLPVAHWEEQPDPMQVQALLAEQEVGVGLVILDPAMALALEHAGCPTVYVDSLPYLWTERDRLPYAVTAYVAQLCDAIPRFAWQPLRQIRHLRWVEGITVPQTARRSGPEPGLAVVSFGGLHSPLSNAGHEVYEQLLLTPTLQALASAGFTSVEVCGNVHGALATACQPASLPELRIAARGHTEFLGLLDRAALLVCSPGLTTLIEAGHRSLPTVCLPPQNLSQILNSDRFAERVHPACRVRWPGHVLDGAAIEQARPQGEEAAVELLYAALAAASRHTARLWPQLEEALCLAIRQAGTLQHWDGLVAGSGVRGAEQVAMLLYDILHQRQH
jgi:hydroxymethylcytosylglucuronate/cytosylglucuronate synthase